ncbi:xylulokinase [Desulfopila aestuarii]|uniref:Xylulose kinase n=1 Tax=Desulfopila aestuarii DSM 18488 TaxID=1121416 RepID=A0A1M7Y5V7_9BACT|nr:xylulokinase [Desulfopila aestuarii]SHO47864.1 xylulokinase [Desulfopila aestuarii DSM 18488]
MADQLYIGIDSGTQGCKVVVVSRSLGKVIAENSSPHTLMENERGGREQDPAVWVTALETALESALSQSLRLVKDGQVKAIGVSGQQHGFVPLDRDGQVIRPAKLWCDTETVPQCTTITERLGGEEATIAAIGNTIAAGFTASKILWLKENEPENYRRLHTILLPHDYLNYWLSGEFSAEHGDASGTAFYDVRNRQWSQFALSAIDPENDLLAMLPPLRDPHQPAGRIRPELAAKWNIPSDVLISSGGGDNMMAAIGTGNVSPGVVTASLGTSGTIYAHSNTPVIDSRGELAAFCSSSGGWLPLVCTMNVTVATELVRNLFGLSLKEFTQTIAASHVGSGGILLLPFFNGERTPALPNGSATLHGMSTTNFTKANLCRAAMEGVTFGLRYGMEVLERNAIAPNEIRLVGGGAKSPVWRQIVADVFGTPVVSPLTTEAGALGSALQAMWCHETTQGSKATLGEICDRFIKLDQESRCQPDEGRRQQYGDIYSRYQQLEGELRRINS